MQFDVFCLTTILLALINIQSLGGNNSEWNHKTATTLRPAAWQDEDEDVAATHSQWQLFGNGNTHTGSTSGVSPDACLPQSVAAA